MMAFLGMVIATLADTLLGRGQDGSAVGGLKLQKQFCPLLTEGHANLRLAYPLLVNTERNSGAYGENTW